MEKCPLVGFEPAIPELQLDAYLMSKVVEAHDFMPDLKVDRFMPIIIEHTALLFYRRRTTLFIRTEANL